MFVKNDPTSIYDAKSIKGSIEATNESMKAKIKGNKYVVIKQVGGQTTLHTLGQSK